MDRSVFRNLVSAAIGSLPPIFLEKIENVEIVVDDFPDPELMVSLALPRDSLLFGLYQGIPKTKRSSSYSMVLPDKITLYQRCIEYVCHTPDQIAAKVRHTLIHEIGHHFGLSESEIRSAQTGADS